MASGAPGRQRPGHQGSRVTAVNQSSSEGHCDGGLGEAGQDCRLLATGAFIPLGTAQPSDNQR